MTLATTVHVESWLKGNPNSKTKNISVFYLGSKIPVDGVQPLGRTFVDFRSSKPTVYLMFLSRDKNGELVPLTGDVDAGVSFYQLQQVKSLPEGNIAPLPVY
jgi:hypothetical protein